MKITATKFYSLLFVFVVFAQMYLASFKANVFLQIIILGIYFFYEKLTLDRNFITTVLPLFLLFLLPFVGMCFHEIEIYNVVKDVFHFIKPLLGIGIGYLFFKKINDFKLFVKSIVLIGLASAMVHFIIIFVFSKTSTVSEIREFGRDNLLELFSLLFLLFYKFFQKENLFSNSATQYLIGVILVASNLLYLSRTMIIVGFICLLSVFGLSIITRKTIKFLLILAGGIALFYFYLFSIKLERESFLYKVKIAPSELFKTHIDRTNHADLWDHWRGYEAKRALALMEENPSSYLLGMGYGSLVNLKFYAPLSDNPSDKGLKYISELHNGYAYVFYKTGIIGVFLYLLFFVGLYKKIYFNKQFVTIFISAIGIAFLFTTITITGIYNTKDTIVFILGGLLFFEHKQLLINKI
jgi:hypothetical protein